MKNLFLIGCMLLCFSFASAQDTIPGKKNLLQKLILFIIKRISSILQHERLIQSTNSVLIKRKELQSQLTRLLFRQRETQLMAQDHKSYFSILL